MEGPIGRTLYGRRRGVVRFRSKIHNNNKRSLGPEQSLSKVGTLPPHDSYIPHGPVASNTHTYIYTHEG